jgi:hypothetical protein
MVAETLWFDKLARGVAAPSSRRFLLGGLLGGLLTPGARRAEAAQPNPGQCQKVGTTACCVPVQNDPENCGACGVACRPDQICASGKCACPTGTTGCGAGASATCVNLQNDPYNCGSCGNACGTGYICVTGKCQVSCPYPEITCGSECVNPTRDPDNCGGCGRICASDEVCLSGTCTPSCPGGETPCGGQCVNTMFDPEQLRRVR